jgi:hypothetical protein
VAARSAKLAAVPNPEAAQLAIAYTASLTAASGSAELATAAEPAATTALDTRIDLQQRST